MTNVTGIDIGYGYTKIVSSDGRRIKFPTVVTGYIPQSTFGDSDIWISVNGKKYLAGQEAQDRVMGNFKVSEDFIHTDDYKALVGRSLVAAKETDLMVLGLPPGLYTDEKTESLKRDIMGSVMESPVGRIHIPEHIFYVPQGAGIYFSYAAGMNPGTVRENVVIIDIGYYTMDVVFFSSNRFISDAARSYPLGSKVLFDKVKDYFAKDYGTFINDGQVEQILTSGRFIHFGKTYTFNASAIVKDFYIDQIQRAIKEYASQLKQYGKVVDRVIVGGGGVIWCNNIYGATIVADPQFANAFGYVKYGESILRKLEYQLQS